MRTAAVVLVSVAALLAAPGALAACPNSCSGHGSCGADDACTCYANWQAGDCSLRTCPYDTAWADVKDSAVTGRQEHFYAECSGRGVCDRQAGVCVCENNFEGDACQRMSCPGGSSCNGHGTCELMSKVNSGYTGWDADKVQVCKCDPGYTGHNCALRKCKLGDDPLTVGEVDEVQTVTFTAVDGSDTIDSDSQFLLGFTDWRGETWYTTPITMSTMTETAIKEALLALPQRAIDKVTVGIVDDSSTHTRSFTVTFTGVNTPGNQPLLTVLTDGCADHGCQPYYKGVTFTPGSGTGIFTTTVVSTTPSTSERAECSARGSCDMESGLCKCYAGFYGQACEKQTLVL